MKLSRFNVWTMASETLIVYNSLTGALLTFDSETAPLVSEALRWGDASCLPTDLLPNLGEYGIVVESDFDELSVVKARNLLGRTQNELILSVMLTMACNFDCCYCFQERSERPNSMGPDVEERVIRYITREAKKRDRISVDWYGGEPLLRASQLMRMNDAVAAACKQWDTEYLVSVTTNGYLLTAELVEYLSNFEVTHLQITLDGPAETHDFSRPLAQGGGTFETIVHNIVRAVGAGIPVIVRVNVWKPNASKFGELYDILEQEGLKNRVSVIAKPVLSSEANPCAERCLPPQEAAAVIMGVYKRAAAKGWVVLPGVDQMQAHEFCIVDSVGQFIFDPSGRVYKCGELFRESESVGCLETDGSMTLDVRAWTRWIGKDPLAFPECVDCEILPMCMGGCSMKRLWRPEESPCLELKKCMSELLRVMVANADNVPSGREGSA